MNESNWNEVISKIQDFPIRISEIDSLNKDIKLSKVSFKYNIDGKETYFNGSKEIRLKTGEYLVANNQQQCEVEIKKGDRKDLGVCIDINTDYLHQALQSYLQPNSFISEDDKLSYFLNDAFFISYQSNRAFHQYMLELFAMIKRNSFDSIQEVECDFIKHFLFHQTPFLSAYKQLPAIKQSTKNELFAKMIEAKSLLHDSIYENISITSLSKQLFLSEYRFYHLFKSTFSVSPHKYLLQLKLNEAMKLYRTKAYTWTEIAYKLQFADVQSFSKLFKKYFRMSPTDYMHQMIKSVYD